MLYWSQYLSGFQAEKRDIEKSDIQIMVDQKVDEYCKEVLKVESRCMMSSNHFFVYDKKTDCISAS